MEYVDSIINTISLSMGAAWASGINLYATLLVFGLLGATGEMVLPPGLEILTHPLVIGASGLMYVVEFFADKIPGVDSGWDAVHSFIRIPAGVVLAGAAAGEMDPAILFSAAVVGGAVSTGSHLAKSGSRVLINTSPEPFTNWTASVAEDLAVIAGLWAALNHPLIFITLLIVFIIVLFWLLPKLWKGIKKVFGFLGRMFGVDEEKTDTTKSEFLLAEPRGEIAEKLETLKDLLEKKHITQEEFDAKRREILDSF